ncbi:MAG: hypothetical protein Q8Q10_02365 [bacterium]|nr:hypothetical protein [bacterium]
MKKEIGNRNKSQACKETSRLPYGLIGKIVLGTIATAGMATIALAAPNIFQAFHSLERQWKGIHRRYRSLAYVKEVVRRLEKQKMVSVFRKDGEIVIHLTEKGRQELLKYELKEKSLEKWHWDKKWRILLFDIEEENRSVRDRMREDMRSFGFVRLQDSAWVFPYECEQAIVLLKAKYGIGKELLHVVAGEIENDGWLKKEFRLD